LRNFLGCVLVRALYRVRAIMCFFSKTIVSCFQSNPALHPPVRPLNTDAFQHHRSIRLFHSRSLFLESLLPPYESLVKPLFPDSYIFLLVSDPSFPGRPADFLQPDCGRGHKRLQPLSRVGPLTGSLESDAQTFNIHGIGLHAPLLLHHLCLRS